MTFMQSDNNDNQTHLVVASVILHIYQSCFLETEMIRSPQSYITKVNRIKTKSSMIWG